jgi:hypothetical protein
MKGFSLSKVEFLNTNGDDALDLELKRLEDLHLAKETSLIRKQELNKGSAVHSFDNPLTPQISTGLELKIRRKPTLNREEKKVME